MSLVLVADDEEAILDVACDVLDALGHETMRAHDGEHALTLARSRPPDLVVSDVMMPRRNGVELVRAMRADPVLADVPVILMSAAREPEVIERLPFLPKPLGLEAFERAVFHALDGRTQRPPQSNGAVALTGNALNGREEMLNWVAHELKTPLGSVKLNAELSQRRLTENGDPAVLRSLEAVVRGVVRMESLINSILDAAGLAEGRVALRRRRTDLREFVQTRVDELREQTPDANLRLELPSEPTMVEIDPERLGQVFDNLISNALKYGGKREPIEVRLERAPSHALVHVRDHGPGISASELPRLFERFHRVEGTKGSGHGLGLFIAAAVARLHGGALAARSGLGEGATFTLTLPHAS